MGIRDFSKCFKETGIATLSNMKGKTIAIDAMTEIYRASLGAQSTHVLTDQYGNPTIHISVILSNVLEMHKAGINQIWIFDHTQQSGEEFHNKAKIAELVKRKKRKDDAKEKIDLLKQTITAPVAVVKNINLITPDDEIELQPYDESNISTNPLQSNSPQVDPSIEAQKQTFALQKQAFTATPAMINDIKIMLNCLNIKYIESPAGFEGEQIAAYLSATDQIDAVYSSDTDPIPFGAKVLYRRVPKLKKIFKYEQTDILKQIKAANDTVKKPTLPDIQTICALLGSDFSTRKKGLGPKTIIKKYKDTPLDASYKLAIETFQKEPLEDIQVHNLDKQAFVKADTQLLIDWLSIERSFNKARLEARLSKIN